LASTALQSLGQDIKLYAHPFSPHFGQRQ